MYVKTIRLLCAVNTVFVKYQAQRGFNPKPAALRIVFENHCSTSNTMSASYYVTTLTIIKVRNHQRLADALLQSGVVTHNSRLWYAINSTVLGKSSVFGETVSIQEGTRSYLSNNHISSSGPNFELSFGSCSF